jgi:DNA-binding transcriptional LysR family regulator
LQIAFLVLVSHAVMRGLRFEELTRDPLRLAVAPGHPLARRRQVTLAEASREPFVAYSRKEYPEYHDLMDRVFSPSSPGPRIAEEHDGVSSLISAVQAGNGVALVAASMACIAGERLKLVPLTPEPEPLVIGLVVPKKGLTAAAERFAQCARDAVLEM